MTAVTLVREESRKIVRAFRAWEWISRHIEEHPPPADGFRHPQVDLEQIAAEAIVRATHDLARLTSLEEPDLTAALVDAGLSSQTAEAIISRHAAWLTEEDR